ncbi:MAG: FMN-binding protein [Tetrasphaera sp.]
MSTISAIVLLFSYPTSTNARITATSQALDDPATTDSAATDSAATGSSTSGSTTDSEAAGSTTDTGSRASDDTSSSTSSQTTTDGSSSTGTTTYAGDAIMTRWGVVQVQITVTDGKITKSEVLQVPWENHEDQQINAYAVPILNQEVVAAQSAQVDMVSGATVTSGGYIQSLQSAIDQAHLS